VDAANDAAQTILSEGRQAKFSPAEKTHRRGRFPAIAVGISSGNGQQVPMRLKHETHLQMVDRLLTNASIQRLAEYASSASVVDTLFKILIKHLTGVFALWAPRLHAVYKRQLDTMYTALPHLKPNFRNSVFPCATFNFGPGVCCFKHRDVKNNAYGWCPIIALGLFDHTRGGHLILWDAKVIIEFPSASCILIPSATMTHSNTPIQPGETRLSFTQYASGELFHWVDNGCRTQKALQKEDPEKFWALEARKDSRWKEGLALYSTMTELLEKVGQQ
jgi:hypothetical protein